MSIGKGVRTPPTIRYDPVRMIIIPYLYTAVNTTNTRLAGQRRCFGQTRYWDSGAFGDRKWSHIIRLLLLMSADEIFSLDPCGDAWGVIPSW